MAILTIFQPLGHFQTIKLQWELINTGEPCNRLKAFLSVLFNSQLVASVPDLNAPWSIWGPHLPMLLSFGSSNCEWYILKLSKNYRLVVGTSIEIWAITKRFSLFIHLKRLGEYHWLKNVQQTWTKSLFRHANTLRKW